MNSSVLDRLLDILFQERGEEVPQLADIDKPILFRALCNVRPPRPISSEFISLQDEYLTELSEKRGIVDVYSLDFKDGVALWQGDITTLKCDGIVNAANSQMLGCFHPCHGCIDNAIHSYAGVQLRLECADIMRKQGSVEKTGDAKITQAYNLPCNYVIHTVGPIVFDRLTNKHREELKECYLSCLQLADVYNLKTLAFCCISTGEFRFPNDEAAKIAVDTVKEYKKRTLSKLKVVFNVFKDVDYELYAKLLGRTE